MLTHDEQERLAFISGDTRTAALIREVTEVMTDELTYTNEQELEIKLDRAFDRGYAAGMHDAKTTTKEILTCQEST